MQNHAQCVSSVRYHMCSVLRDIKVNTRTHFKILVSDLICCRPEDVQALISGKLALRYAGRQVSHVVPASLNATLIQFELYYQDTYERAVRMS